MNKKDLESIRDIIREEIVRAGLESPRVVYVHDSFPVAFPPAVQPAPPYITYSTCTGTAPVSCSNSGVSSEVTSAAGGTNCQYGEAHRRHEKR